VFHGDYYRPDESHVLSALWAVALHCLHTGEGENICGLRKLLSDRARLAFGLKIRREDWSFLSYI